MKISLTEKAAYHINKYLENRGRGIGIRAAVKTTGCSGLMYVIEPVDRLIEEDLKFESYGVDIFVDPKSLIYLKGTEMDYVKKGLNEGFEFKNPNVKTECGCGESFVV
jgi:iron-sulfur cluster assembly protein|tara:strand:- start:13806 stop:14129 length:324 start_codon:yes stop_codon:yes gene_type:complete